MKRMSIKGRLMATTMAGSALLLGAAGQATAQIALEAEAGTQAETTAVDDIVVTGSRIRRVQTTTTAPVSVIDAEVLSERGFVQVGQALNQITSAAPSAPLASGSGSAAGSGQQFPNLFGLGAGRTLSLVNGRRFVTSSSGMGDRVVDTNLIPTGLLERVDVVQAGGAAVYGSDAIAGVINYVLKDDFEGLEVDAQYGISSRDDYPQTSLRMTLGDNYLDGRANLAANVEWSKSDPLYGQDRPRSNLSRLTVSNSANTSATDGVPAVRERGAEARLDGEVRFCPFAHAADLLLVACADHSLVALPAATPGMTITRKISLDPTRPLATVRFHAVIVEPAWVLGGVGSARGAIAAAQTAGAGLLSAELTGVAAHSLASTVDYAQQRVQFGRTIGSFQAVKHTLADMMVQVEAARSAYLYAAAALDMGGPEAVEAASVAKAWCGDAANQCAGEAIQLHGGIGFTWEHPAHLYFKRARSASVWLGDPASHREIVAGLIGLDAPAPEPA